MPGPSGRARDERPRISTGFYAYPRIRAKLKVGRHQASRHRSPGLAGWQLQVAGIRAASTSATRSACYLLPDTYFTPRLQGSDVVVVVSAAVVVVTGSVVVVVVVGGSAVVVVG